MFEKLVESTRTGTTRRGRYFFATSVVYGALFMTLCVLTIVWANPMPADSFNSAIMLAPPVIAAAPPKALAQPLRAAPRPSFASPTEIPPGIPDPRSVRPLPKIIKEGGIAVAGAVSLPGSSWGEPMGRTLPVEVAEAPPPPVRERPAATPTPASPKTINMSTGVLQGLALRRPQPAYPNIARQVKAQGTVQVQITISEDGRVIEASVLGGHALLREAARQSALQWVFSPTLLSGKPVKVSGVISFNFLLN